MGLLELRPTCNPWVACGSRGVCAHVQARTGPLRVRWDRPLAALLHGLDGACDGVALAFGRDRRPLAALGTHGPARAAFRPRSRPDRVGIALAGTDLGSVPPRFEGGRSG